MSRTYWLAVVLALTVEMTVAIAVKVNGGHVPFALLCFLGVPNAMFGFLCERLGERR